MFQESTIKILFFFDNIASASVLRTYASMHFNLQFWFDKAFYEYFVDY